MTHDSAIPGAPAGALDWTEAGAPRSRRFGDVYYSLQDGLAETRAVFLSGCGLPDAWAGRSRFTVAELGFGTGLNVAGLLDLWRRAGPVGGRLHVFSVEAFPVARGDAARALSAWPEIEPAASALLSAWPRPTPGFHRIDLPGWNATLDLATGDAAWALGQWRGRADAWFLDGFSPAVNPDMWSDAVLDGVAARSAPGARLATFTVAGAVRRGLSQRGFTVEKRPGHGRKRERLEAVFHGRAGNAPAPAATAVIGAGIAGAALARALSAQGVTARVFEAEGPGAGASGFPAALVTPRLDAGDLELAALFAQALERAGDLYCAIPGAVIAEGVLRLEQGPRDAGRFDRVAAQPLWREGAMVRLDADQIAERLGEPVGRGALLMADALTVRPAAVLEAWLAGAERRAARVARLERREGLWALLDAQGGLIDAAGTVALAAGWGAAALLDATLANTTLADTTLAPVRGQAGWSLAPVPGAPEEGAAWGGYAAPTGAGLLYGATHDRDDADAAPRPRDDRRNLESLAAILPRLAARLEAAPRAVGAGVRAVTPDRLPMAGPLGAEAGLHGLLGLGSRGFATAPLLAEHLAAGIAGAPSPLPEGLARRIDPSRPALSRRPRRA